MKPLLSGWVGHKGGELYILVSNHPVPGDEFADFEIIRALPPDHPCEYADEAVRWYTEAAGLTPGRVILSAGLGRLLR